MAKRLCVSLASAIALRTQRGDLVISTVLSAFSAWFGGGETLFWQAVNFVGSVGVLAVLFAMLFKWFPDADVRWTHAFYGGVATSLLFNIGKLVIAWYIGSQGLESTYGAAASIVVLLIWTYYSAQILLFGAEVTHVLGEGQTRISPGAAEKELRRFGAVVKLNGRSSLARTHGSRCHTSSRPASPCTLSPARVCYSVLSATTAWLLFAALF